MYTVSGKKGPTVFLPLTSMPNADHFPNSFTDILSCTFLAKQ